MGDKEILCTYKCDGIYFFEWLYENEVDEWIEDWKDRYEDVEVIRIKVTDILYQS